MNRLSSIVPDSVVTGCCAETGEVEIDPKWMQSIKKASLDSVDAEQLQQAVE